MFDPIGDIKAFHEKFGLQYNGPPRYLERDLSDFRVAFLSEEVEEYDIQAKTLEDKFDALIDLAYVLFGTLYLHGLLDRLPEGWDRVHRANMQKVRAQNAADSKRNSTHDVIKPPGWTPPDLQDLVR